MIPFDSNNVGVIECSEGEFVKRSLCFTCNAGTIGM